MTDRRTFMKQQALALAGVGLGVRRWPLGLGRQQGRPIDPTTVATMGALADSVFVRTLALRAIDAAKAAGASYADVRVTRQLKERWYGSLIRPVSGFELNESLAIGVRVLVKGCWGFAASPYWDLEEVVRLAREAANQATHNAQATPRSVSWKPIPVASGHWNTPIHTDPFTVPLEEKRDLIDRWGVAAGNLRRMDGGEEKLGFSRQERAVATSDGAYFTQTLYQSSAAMAFTYRQGQPPYEEIDVLADLPGTIGAGWEFLRDANIIEQLPRMMEEAKQKLSASSTDDERSGDIGQYDVVFSANMMRQFVDKTLGSATELDRAMGYEANAGGTSFLADPFGMLGSYPVGSPLLTLTANRSAPLDLATVKWDDEGVEPEDYALIKDGVLMDYQTTREQATWLAPVYEKLGRPVRSRGCAGADEALSVTLQHRPNLVLQPGKEDLSFEDLIKDTKRGVAVFGGEVRTDFQGKNGVGLRLGVREIVNGKLGMRLSGLGLLFSTNELWKNLVAIGGPKSSKTGNAESRKGQPQQATDYTVRAVPAKIKNLSFIDPLKKA